MPLSPWPNRTPFASAVPTVDPVWQRWLSALVVAVAGVQSNTLGPIIGSPEGVVTAPQGTLLTRSDGGAATSLYVKTTGGTSTPTNTGWVAK